MKKAKQFFFILIAITIPAIAMTYLILSKTEVHCEVCMEFKGKSQCRNASGPDQEQCKRTAATNACAFLASGMTDSMACDSTEPVKVSFNK